MNPDDKPPESLKGTDECHKSLPINDLQPAKLPDDPDDDGDGDDDTDLYCPCGSD